MSDVYDRAFAFCQTWEGGLCDDKNDRGGITNRGVSIVFLKDFARRHPETLKKLGIETPITRDTIRHISLVEAKEIFRREFWPKAFDDVADFAPRVAVCLFDAAVNMGLRMSIKLLQRALLVDDDGIIGPKTIAAVKDMGDFMAAAAMLEQRKLRYHMICERNPSQRVFLKGWLNRVSSLCLEISR